MKSLIIPVLTIGLVAGSLHAADAPKTMQEKVSYIIGYNIGRNLARDGVDVKLDQVLEGLKAGVGGKEPVISSEESQQIMQAFQQQMMAKQQATQSEAGKAAAAEGAAFLATNGKKEGIKTTASGLQYQVIKDGTGKTPKPTDQVTTHYRGTLISGKQFDSSYDRGEPATFPVNGVIAGWTEALQLMKEGAKWKLFIPSNLAYGERGAGADIPPNATLIFDIELIKVGG
ncbi:MAG: FKBP-type peptidyl-prolyl cis-trans isomerase [Verrucomicrobiae bacterium]|jgi:FKBP-type peptidyl-prolyl cis-trans isomerase FklB|nr:FKBP-type peptidyl-prolyl cis-trans isomerase [Verrucomicrobiae bacterium]